MIFIKALSRQLVSMLLINRYAINNEIVLNTILTGIENSRLRHIRLHERINELPDPNYATCKHFLGHLEKVRQHNASNSMSISNLAIVFGPTLLGPPPTDASAVLQDMQWQCKAIETILEHYAEIFVDADEESPGRFKEENLPGSDSDLNIYASASEV